MSPFARLPLDVVHIIFLYCLPTDHNPYICVAEPPMLLTHVCRRWREVAFDMPLLWASIHVHIPFYPELPASLAPQAEYRGQPDTVDQLEPAQRAAYLSDVFYWESKMRDLKDMVVQWLARAKGCQISLSLSQFTNLLDNAKGTSQVNDVVAVLLAYCGQWKSVELYASSPTIAQFLAVHTQDAPHLQRISIKWQTPMERNLNRGANKVALVSPEGLMTVPELKSLSLQILPRNIMSLPVRWEGLTELIFDEYFYGLDSESLRRRFLPSDALDLLALCPRLVRCRLAIGRGRMIGASPPQSPLTSPSSNGNNSSLGSDRTPVRKLIPLPCLEHLAIDEGISLGDFFLCLHLPSLKEVVFSTALTPCEDETPSHSQQSGQSTTSAPIAVPGVTGQLPYTQQASSSSRHADASSPLIDLLSQYGRNLEKLTFDEAGLSLRDIERALDLVPNLTHLTMNRKSMSRWSSVGFGMTGGRQRAAPGYLSKGLLERLTPKPVAGGSHINTATASLCPRLISFSGKLSAPIEMQDTLIEFIKWRRYPWANTYHPSLSNAPPPAVLQKCTINFSSYSSPTSSYDVQDLKDISAELSSQNVDMHEFDLNIIYPNVGYAMPFKTGGGSGGGMGSGGSGNGRALMSSFVPKCRNMSAGVYGFSSWYATGGGGGLRDMWFEAW
ncbi:hypothetical protein CC1G_03331 [Coprinopsis cinerea okayama7|uniref:Uncharacterized protein n=1 Tax=Coprinopsis cinerea (strain Okayama-7 / 130 / ATCC MYA-4618 / FGSC 9003) TaxID=240176 RepID=A8N7I8_COPC7|nr:hypothetical protein CC1G_03331 [Coprinopsis cinerea okayama7\|eukprot:XP_001830794.1 hypothetical protein CC1G_03331 [Coprinopsis cinerea okayama7\